MGPRLSGQQMTELFAQVRDRWTGHPEVVAAALRATVYVAQATLLPINARTLSGVTRPVKVGEGRDPELPGHFG
jgi:hypothetical protein